MSKLSSTLEYKAVKDESGEIILYDLYLTLDKQWIGSRHTLEQVKQAAENHWHAELKESETS